MRPFPKALFPIVSSGPNPVGWLASSSNGIRSFQKRNPLTTKSAFSAQLGLKLKTIFMPMLICEPLLFCCGLHRRHVECLSMYFFGTYKQMTYITGSCCADYSSSKMQSRYGIIFGTKIRHIINDRWLHPPLIPSHLIFSICCTTVCASRFNYILFG